MKKYLLTGATVLVPIGFVLWVLYLFWQLDGFIRSLLGVNIYGVGLIILALATYFTGVVVSTRLGSWFHEKLETLIDWVKPIDRAYDFAKDVVNMATNTNAFEKVVKYKLTDNVSKIGFLTNEGTIFAPSSPNPLSGQVVTVEEYEELDITVEDAMKYLASLGMVKKH